MKIFDRVLLVFSNDLRIDDNPTLLHASNIAVKLACVYCLDTALHHSDRFGLKRTSPNRAKFLSQSLDDLNRSLKNLGQSLTLLEGQVEYDIANLIVAHQINAVVYSQSAGTYENRLWMRLKKQFSDTEFHGIASFTLFDTPQMSCSGTFFQTFSQFKTHAQTLSVPPSQASPTTLPASFLPTPKSIRSQPSAIPQPPHTGGKQKTEPSGNVLAMNARVNNAAKGGEKAANTHIGNYFSSSAPLRYKETRNALEGWDNSTKLSFWLANGNLSVRKLYHTVKHYEQLHGANESTYWIVFELLWREFFQCYAHHYAEKLFYFKGIANKAPLTSFYPGRFKKWCEGSTPWPLVNACMKQLNHSGYLSNRGRQIVASALVNELQLDWRCGAAYFEQQLLDYDVASNWGNWQYIAGVGADPRGGRHFSIEKQHQRFDKGNVFINTWTDKNPGSDILDTVDAADWPIR